MKSPSRYRLAVMLLLALCAFHALAETPGGRPDAAAAPLLDFDNDGTPDEKDEDDDGDLYKDSDEIVAGTNPYDAKSNPGPQADIDGDGLVNSVDDDDDGDGFSDEVEFFSGMLGTNAASVPALATIENARLRIGLNFAKGNRDRLQLSGTLLFPAGFPRAIEIVYVETGGSLRAFVLSERGRGSFGGDTFLLKKYGRARAGTQAARVNFFLSIRLADLSGSLADEGFSNQTVSFKKLSVFLRIIITGAVYETLQPQIYSATAGRTGHSR
ncbi:MAG TPA: hypothetical protein VEK08_09840 [Planctomycetota bacterium]|nr:hypothetical protein [Planctomycetota bacterium]